MTLWGGANRTEIKQICFLIQPTIYQGAVEMWVTRHAMVVKNGDIARVAINIVVFRTRMTSSFHSFCISYTKKQHNNVTMNNVLACSLPPPPQMQFT